jgi:hypothetical protein
MAVAWAQLTFNVVMMFAVLLVLRVFRRRVESLDATSSSALVSAAQRSSHPGSHWSVSNGSSQP